MCITQSMLPSCPHHLPRRPGACLGNQKFCTKLLGKAIPLDNSLKKKNLNAILEITGTDHRWAREGVTNKVYRAANLSAAGTTHRLLPLLNREGSCWHPCRTPALP